MGYFNIFDKRSVHLYHYYYKYNNIKNQVKDSRLEITFKNYIPTFKFKCYKVLNETTSKLNNSSSL